MSDSMKLLEEKVGKAIELVDKLTSENKSFVVENRQLKAEVKMLKEEISGLKINDRDRSEKVRAKLNSLLKRLEDLEQL